ncbi:MarR family winged helix-turn-helix transcriptional regulator [Alicyclobacillus sp. ALC3]|uniref:MarR family winged helix-turn-helix transcriptional regulator n=1 Tax=Alicyclobacillus sp. ALC3 TaxID=2796143 RepID=UPI0023785222|nr:MarR family transcriptional regulator [Alicyclobacillus sp. ALC3]WDL97533.1 MarR family transcriptional regulator [Alicyclobacillus sp. ALC3]
MDHDVFTALHLYRVLARSYASVMEYTADDLKAFQLPPTEFAVLELLYHKGPQPLQKIGERILRTSGSVTYVIDKLEKAKLIERVPDASDRRVTYAVLTDLGRNKIDVVFPAHADRITESFSHLTSAEQRQLADLLKKLGLGIEKRKGV